MALITCPECGKAVSEHAKACPNCGYPIARDDSAPIGAHTAGVDGNAKETGNVVRRAYAEEANGTYRPQLEKASPDRKPALVLGAVIVCVAVLIGAVVFMTTPRYTGLPDQVASQVGYISSFSDGPKVTVAVHVDRVEEGDESVIMWDLDQSYIVGFAHFSEPALTSCYGDVEITGNVSSCDGVDELDLKNATIRD